MVNRSGGEERKYAAVMVSSDDVRSLGLRALLRQEPLVELVAEVAVPELARAVSRLQPDLVLVVGDHREDLILRAAQELDKTESEAKLLVFVDAVDADLQAKLVRAGAASFVIWADVNRISLRWLIGSALEGRWYVTSPEAIKEVVLARERPRFSELEERLLRGLVRGMTDEELGRELGVSARTARRLRTDLQESLGAENRVQLIARAVELGFGR